MNAKKVREEKFEMRGLGGRAVWENIDDLPLDEHQKACVLEWLTQKLEEQAQKHEKDVWSYQKSYDPLQISVEEKTAHSYVMDMWDGGRHHEYETLTQVEECIFEDFFNCWENKWEE